MRIEIILALASIVGAVAFFGAGLLTGRATKAALPKMSREDEQQKGEIARLIAAHQEQVDVFGEETRSLRRDLEVAHATLHALERKGTELDGLRSEREKQQKELQVTQVLLEHREAEARRAKAQATEAENERRRLQSALAGHEESEKTARRTLSELDRLKIEQRSLSDQKSELESRLAVIDPETEKTLRHDLAVSNEVAMAAERRAKRLEETNVTLLVQADELRRRLLELESLRSEVIDLRGRALVASLAPAPARVATASATAANAAQAQRGFAWQGLVDDESNKPDVRAAVVADELGLVVASHGDHSDELAAIGALFARAGSQAKNVLALKDVNRLVVEDEQGVTVTVRPLHDYDDHAAATELALVTLAIGLSSAAHPIAGAADGVSVNNHAGT